MLWITEQHHQPPVKESNRNLEVSVVVQHFRHSIDKFPIRHIHFPPETTSIVLLVRILAAIIQSSERDTLKAQFMQLCHRTINEEDEIAHKLLG